MKFNKFEGRKNEEEEDAEMKKDGLKNEKKMDWIENVITGWKWKYNKTMNKEMKENMM